MEIAGVTADVAKGAKIFKTKCAQCHTVEQVRACGMRLSAVHCCSAPRPAAAPRAAREVV